MVMVPASRVITLRQNGQSVQGTEAVEYPSGTPTPAPAPTLQAIALSGSSGKVGNYLNTGDVVQVTATFSAPVTVTGAPRATITVGSTARSATYQSGSGTSSLVFVYTVQSGETDADGISIPVNAIALNGGTIKGSGGADATLTSSAVAANGAYLVDAVAPAAPVINVIAGNDVINASEATSAITGTAEANATVNLTLGSGNVRTVTANGSGAWTYTLVSADITAMGQGAETISATATDAAGNISAATTRAITIDTVAPTISSVGLSGSGAQNSFLNAGDTITATVTFDSVVTVTDSPQMALTVGSTTRQAAYLSGTGSNAILFRYTIASGDTDVNGISVAANSLALNGGSIVDAAGNPATLTHGAVTDQASWKVDTTAPATPTLALGVGVADGATHEEATAGTGVITVSAENGSAINVTFARAGNTVTKAATGTGSALPITLTSGDLATLGNGTISISVTATDLAGNISAAATTSFVLLAPAIPAPSWSSPPTIAGTPTVGETLTATGGAINDGEHAGWQWLRDDVLISGATGSTYTLIEADEDAMIAARELATGDGGSAHADSDAVGPIEAASELIVGPEYWDFEDDFETPPGVTPMTGRAGWSGDLDKWVTDNGTVHQTVSFGPAVVALLGDAPWGDIDVIFDYVTDAIDAAGHGWADGDYFYVWHGDADNHILLRLDRTLNRLAFQFKSTEHSATLMISNDLRDTSVPSFAGRGSIRVQIKDNRLRVWVDGIAWRHITYSPPFNYVDVTSYAPTPSKRQGLVGMRQATRRYPIADGIAARAADIACDEIDGCVGRDAYTGPGASVGTVTYSGRFTGTPVAWVSRLLDAINPKTVLRDWQEVTATTSAGTYEIEEALPIGGPYVVEHGFIDGAGLRHTVYSRPTLVAHRFIVNGQSTAVSRDGAGSYTFTEVARGAIPARTYNDQPAAYPDGYMVNGRDPYIRTTSYPGWTFVKALTEIIDAPVMFEAYGVPAAGIGAIMEGSAGWAAFTAALATRKGVIEGVIWDQGQGDVDTTTAPANLATYPGSFLDHVVAPLRLLTGNPNLPIFISHMGRYSSTTAPAGLSWSVFDGYRDAHRKMKFALTTEGGGSDPHIHTSSHHTGLVYFDSYHPAGQNGLGRLNHRDAWSIAKHVFGLPVHDGRGPIPTGVTRSGATLTIEIDLNGATSLSEVTFDTRMGTAAYPTQPANRFKGWDFSTSSNFGTLLEVTSIVVSGPSLIVTLAADPGGPVYARHLYGAGYNDMVTFQGIYSAEAYDQSIPIEPTMGATGYLVSN